LERSSQRSARSGGVLALGEDASEYWKVFDELRACWAAWGAEAIWLSPLRAGLDQPSHPQQVAAEHSSGSLPHAACLSFFDELADPTSKVYCGVAVVHRREPLRPLDPDGRLEAYHVAETIIVGDRDYCGAMYSRIREQIGRLLAGHVSGQWKTASDLFDTGLLGKEEWIFGSGAQSLAIASGNLHGSSFLRRRQLPGESCCFGVGIERLVEAKRRTRRGGKPY
jgi:hypothetical protein